MFIVTEYAALKWQCHNKTWFCCKVQTRLHIYAYMQSDQLLFQTLIIIGYI